LTITVCAQQLKLEPLSENAGGSTAESPAIVASAEAQNPAPAPVFLPNCPFEYPDGYEETRLPLLGHCPIAKAMARLAATVGVTEGGSALGLLPLAETNEPFWGAPAACPEI
jgi:hypothetical protein